MGESESSLVEDDDDDDEFVIVRTHARTHTHAATHNAPYVVHRAGEGRLLAGQAGRQIGRWMLDRGP